MDLQGHEGAERWQCHVLTLFPDFFQTPLEASILGRGQEAGHFSVHLHQIRAFSTDRHGTADDSPYGGGAGMVMKAEPLVAAIEHVMAQCPAIHRVLLTPQGQPFCQATARRLATLPALALICGRYEGVDERVREAFVDEELSIGDYVLTGGEVAAMVVIDAVTRLLPGVLGNAASTQEESFGLEGLLEYPQYTRPALFRGMAVPDILRSGDHGAVRRWRRQQALARTLRRRPDLLLGAALTREDESWLAEQDREVWEKLRDNRERMLAAASLEGGGDKK